MSENDTTEKKPRRRDRWIHGPAKGYGSGNWGSDGTAKGEHRRENGYQPKPRKTPEQLELRKQQVEELKDLIVSIAKDPNQPGSVRVSAANSFFDRIEGKPVARQEVKLNVDPKELSDAELAALIRSGDDDER